MGELIRLEVIVPRDTRMMATIIFRSGVLRSQRMCFVVGMAPALRLPNRLVSRENQTTALRAVAVT
jgi:hypothetical protein